jgi:hypothetical protein
MQILREGVNQPCPLYMVDYEGSRAVCDNTLLLEWPIEDVETDCNAYRKLVKGCSHQLSNYSELVKAHWTDQLLGKGDIVLAEEVDPRDAEIHYFRDNSTGKGGTVVFQADKRCYYHAHYFDIVFEFVLQDLNFGIYIPHPHDRVAQFIRYLVVFEGEHMVGVICNQLYRDEGSEVLLEDPETGKVLVGNHV